MSEEEEQSKVVRRGPFYAPRPLTEKEKKEKELKRKINRKLLDKMFKDGSFDRATQIIAMMISYVSFPLAKFYLWRSQMFNFMLVGASGCILGWLLFNIFRPLLFFEFLAWVVATLCVFMWNYTWNKVWSLNAFAQLNFMKRAQLQEMRERIDEILRSKKHENLNNNRSSSE
jgi:hypothetical protein